MITLRQLDKSFSVKKATVAALREVDLKIESGELFVLLGPSGSGKTTLLRCVAGLEKPDAGEIALGQRLVFSSKERLCVPPEEREIGMVFQSYAVWPHLSVFENVALPLTHGIRRWDPSMVKEKVRSALGLVQLEGLEERPAPLLSGGQQQRVALARALAVEPKALLMDEPLSNLDARLREEVRSQIRDVTKKVGVTVLYVTHDQVEAMALADRLGVMNGGRILDVGPPQALYEHPARPEVAEFFGMINWLDGRAVERGRIETKIGLIQASSSPPSGAVKVGIRPENLRLHSAPRGEANEFRGQVMGKVYLGDHQLWKVQIRSELLMVKVVGQPERGWLGGEVSLCVPRDAIFVFSIA